MMHKFLDAYEALSFSLVFGQPKDLVEQFLIFASSEEAEWTQLPDGSFHGKRTVVRDGARRESSWEFGQKHGEEKDYIHGFLSGRTFYERGKKRKCETYDVRAGTKNSEFEYDEEGNLSGTFRQWILGGLYTETEYENGQINGEQRTYRKGTEELHSTSYWEEGIPKRVVIH
ncbi:hypothetical protein ISTM_213 [Insectomime virus]|nr:hypothetical protein ISTM_213 [Insectomime virus]